MEETWLVNLNLGSDDWSYCEEFSSREEAIEGGKELAKKEGMNSFEIGKQNWVGIPVIDADDILTGLIDQVYNECDEHAESYEVKIDSITYEQYEELEDALNNVIFVVKLQIFPQYDPKHKSEKNVPFLKAYHISSIK